MVLWLVMCWCVCVGFYGSFGCWVHGGVGVVERVVRWLWAGGVECGVRGWVGGGVGGGWVRVWGEAG